MMATEEFEIVVFRTVPVLRFIAVAKSKTKRKINRKISFFLPFLV